MEDRRQTVRDFLARYLRSREIGDEDDIFALGYVNSLVALQLVQFLETEFGITVEDEDLDLGNFRSIARIDGFVARKTGVPA